MTGAYGEIPRALAMGSGYLLVFLIGELVQRRFPEKSEVSRKIVHILGGVAALSFPFIFASHWTVLALATCFSAIIFVTKRSGALRSIHGVTRRSDGGIYYAAAIYLVFLLGHDTPVFYFIAILVMTTSDALAALVGIRYGMIKYDVEGHTKSLEGSLTFFFITFLAIHLPLLLWSNVGRAESALIALIIALLVTAFEAISLAGSDNIFVPFGAFFLLGKHCNLSVAEVAWQLAVLGVMVMIAALLYTRPRLLGTSGLIAMILINYAAISLCNFFWFLPLLLAQIMYYILILNYAHYEGRAKITSFQVKTLLYLGLAPTLYIFAANTLKDYTTLFLPFTAAVAAHLAIICNDFVPFIARTFNLENFAVRHRLATALFAVVLTTLFVATAPIILYAKQHQALSVAFAFAGIMTAFYINYVAEASRGGGRAALDYRIRLGSATTGSLLTLLLQQALM